ncbi:hypothetical protein M9Y10_002514 [Tritrichomonas musculus]|uniref:Protein kinase domain-containing protein n=1 Tax=Tritrichomonas musculus TaxID=1915356 RepID=A0ABR2L9Z5_9EUKA
MLFCGSTANLNNFKETFIIHQNQNTTITIGKDPSNPSNKYIFKTFNTKCVTSQQQKAFLQTFYEISAATISNMTIPVPDYAIYQNKNIFSLFNYTHYYENYSFVDFNCKLQPTFFSLSISETTLDKILRKQVQLSNVWTLEDSLNCLFSIAVSMKRLHDNFIIHGNLCPSNILIDRAKQCYVSDFGLYKIKKLYYNPPFINSQYSAPELDQFYPTKATDIFSYGVIVCRLLQDSFFSGPNNIKIVQLVLDHRIDKLSPLPSHLVTIITQCLDQNPEKRCNFNLIIETFQNKTFNIKRINIASIFSRFQQTNYVEKLAMSDDPNALNMLGDLFSDPSKAYKVMDDKDANNSQGVYSNKNSKSYSNKYFKYNSEIDEVKAAECYEKSASFGNSEAQANYGVCLINGRGISRDILTGMTNIEKSASQGCIKGLFYLGMCHLKGFGVSKVDLKAAEKYLQMASEALDNNIINVNESIVCKAIFNLALVMEKNKKIDEAAKCLRKAAILAIKSKINFTSTVYICPEALYCYAHYLEKGSGLPVDLDQAQHFYKLAHYQNYDPGSLKYVKFILEGKNEKDSNQAKLLKEEAHFILKQLVEKGYKKAIKYSNSLMPIKLKSSTKSKSHNDVESNIIYDNKIREKFDKLHKELINKQSQHLFDFERDFIESKNADIIYKFADFYNQGKYVKQDNEKANYYYKLAAELGNSEAQYLYGQLLLKGKIGPDYNKDIELGLKMLKESALQENMNGMCSFLLAFDTKEYKKYPIMNDISWLKNMADKGSPAAQFCYGKCILKNVGNIDPNDQDKGAKYIKMAADANFQNANYAYAMCMFRGKGIPKDEKKAIQLIENIANNENNPKAIQKCIKYYKNIDYKKELHFMKKLADLGNEDYMFSYGKELIKNNSDEKYVKEGEKYLIKSGKEIPSDIHLRFHFKDENRKYIEGQEKKAQLDQEQIKQKMRKLEEAAFSDDDDDDSVKEIHITNHSNHSSSHSNHSSHLVLKKLSEDNEDSDLEDDIENDTPKRIKLTSEEKKKLDRNSMLYFLEQRKENGDAQNNVDEINSLSEAYNGDTKSMNYLGSIFTTTTDNNKIIENGAFLISFSAARDDPEGLMLISKLYFDGIHFRKSKKKSFDYMQMAAKYKIPEALHELGMKYTGGIGTNPSIVQAIPQFEEAVKLKYVPSMIQLAKIYRKKGGKKNGTEELEKMKMYLEMAIDTNNNTTAKYMLGSYYLKYAKDSETAIKYLKEAALKRHKKACFKLYKMSTGDYYGEKNITKKEAENYLNIACSCKYGEALEAYKEKYGREYKFASDNSVSEDDELIEDDIDSLNKKKVDIQGGVNNSNFEDDKNFFMHYFNINIAHYTTQEIIKKADTRFSDLTKEYKQKVEEIKNTVDSNSVISENLKLAQDEFEEKKKLIIKCYQYAMNKGDPYGYFKFAKALDDPNQALSYMQYAKEHKVKNADVEVCNIIEEIGKEAEEEYKARKSIDPTAIKTYKKKILKVSRLFFKEKDYVYAAVWFKKINDFQDYSQCIELAKKNFDSLDKKQQDLLNELTGNNMNSNSNSSYSIKNPFESNGSNQSNLNLFNGSTNKILITGMNTNEDDPQKLNELGLSFLEGKNGVNVDYKKAASYFEKAASKENLDAIVNYGKCFLFGKGVNQDDKKAFYYFKKASYSCPKPIKKIIFSSDSDSDSDSESTTTSSGENEVNYYYYKNIKKDSPLLEGMCYYAHCLLNGRGTPDDQINFNKAMKVFLQAAHLGSVEAMLQYGTHCIDEPNGPEMLKNAADEGNPEAQFMYSKYLEDKDQDLGLKYLKTAAENRSYKPFFITLSNDEENSKIKRSAGYYEPAVEAWGAKLYENVEDDPDSAIQYFTKLANEKNVYGLIMCATCINEGIIDENEDESDNNGSDSKYRKYLKEAADLGDSESQFLYARDKSIDEDESNYSEEVSRYYKLAADQGNIPAQIEYAQRLEGGKGVKKNLDEAIRYCKQILLKDPNNGIVQIILQGIIREKSQTDNNS